MEKTNILGLILAGGRGSRLSVLSWGRAKPALSFGGKYRLIDFTLSNCINSGVERVGLLVQYCHESLTAYIGTGKPWELERGLHFLPPPLCGPVTLSYEGTADAVYKNLAFIEEMEPQVVLVLAGDHIYPMDYRRLVDCHLSLGADATVGLTEAPWKEAHRYGIVTLDREGLVVDFQEKPAMPQSNLASMGIYAFRPQVLREVLIRDAVRRDSGHDFGRDILPWMLGKYRVAGYRHGGYWVDVGTVETYWETNMELLTDSPLLGLFYGERRVRTRHQDYPPARTGPWAQVSHTLLCNGCLIEGSVSHSVLSRSVHIEEGAEVRDSVLLEGAVVRRGARVHRAVVDERAEVGMGAMVGFGDDNVPNGQEPQVLNSGIVVVGAGAVLPPGIKVGRNCRIAPDLKERDFPVGDYLPAGSSVDPPTLTPTGAPR